MEKKILGIIGGMGPLATADLFTKIVNMTDASCDEEHLHVLIDNNPCVPNRTKAILEGNDSPVPVIVSIAKNLEKMGAEVLVLPCNTSHAFYDKITAKLNVPLINMVEETAKYLAEKGIKKVCLFATKGTIISDIYKTAAKKQGIELCYPSDEGIEELMRIIYDGVKAGKRTWDTGIIQGEIDRLRDEGYSHIILGCTELPIAANDYHLVGNFVDPTLILAEKAIEYCGYKVKGK